MKDIGVIDMNVSKTVQDWANFLGKYIAMDEDGLYWWYENKPVLSAAADIWHDPENGKCGMLDPDLVAPSYDGLGAVVSLKWCDSLKVPN